VKIKCIPLEDKNLKENPVCPKCGSKDTVEHGLLVDKTVTRVIFHCFKCDTSIRRVFIYSESYYVIHKEKGVSNENKVSMVGRFYT